MNALTTTELYVQLEMGKMVKVMLYVFFFYQKVKEVEEHGRQEWNFKIRSSHPQCPFTGDRS